MYLTLSSVFSDPTLVTYALLLPTGDVATLRPLQASDVDHLAAFLTAMSAVTKRFSVFASYDRAGAQELCDAINRYDKLRFVLELSSTAEIIGLFEFSFGIPQGDLERYASYGLSLDERSDCRFGPTIADAYQDQGVGSLVFPHMVDVARKFGKERMILWGGVLSDNARAIRFYEKHGFRPCGTFVDHEGLPALDMILELAAYSG